VRLLSQIKLLLVAALLTLTAITPAYALDWADLWSSAEQRAARQFNQQQFDELIQNAPDANWKGLGEYRKGDYSAAAQSFEQRRAQAQEAGLDTEVERAMYNQANAHVLEENYQAAIDLFDELLESNPQHANAEHNRDIAQQLIEQQQQEQQQQSGEQSEQSDEEQSESGENQDQADKQDEQSQQEQDQQSEDAEQSQNQDGEQSEQQQQNDSSSQQQADSDSQSDEMKSEEASADQQEQAEQDAAAERAMQAERERQAENSQTENVAESQNDEPVTPLTEREQANEQWLRQIPDDPAGLLRNKIDNRHQTDFPKVQDSDKPW